MNRNEEGQADTPPIKAKRDTKTHHLPGYRKPVKNPTTNYPKDSHEAFCKRCLGYNRGICPKTGFAPSKTCDL